MPLPHLIKKQKRESQSCESVMSAVPDEPSFDVDARIARVVSTRQTGKTETVSNFAPFGVTFRSRLDEAIDHLSDRRICRLWSEDLHRMH